MKENIHSKLNDINVTCSCGNTFKIKSVLKDALEIEYCNECHPFYSGKHKLADSTGKVDKFRQRFGNLIKS